MKAKFETKGFDRLQIKLNKRARGAKGGSVIVGYTANYAIYVHENVGAHFQRPGAQAKFLEEPLRKNKKKYVRIVSDTVEKGGTFRQGLLLGGLALQRDSQKICPVDTGNLRASAFTREGK